MELKPGSIAIDAGQNPDNQQYDQLAHPTAEGGNPGHDPAFFSPGWADLGFPNDTHQRVQGARTDIGAIESPGTVPSAPVNLAPSNVTNSAVTLNWTPGTGGTTITGYTVFFRKQGDATFTQAGTTNANTTTFTVTGLTPNTAYEFIVTSHDANGNQSLPSNIANATTLNGPVTPPLSIVSTGNGAVRLINPSTGAIFLSLRPFDTASTKYTSLVSVALGDISGDGVPDLIVATRGNRNGRIKVYDGQSAINGQVNLIDRLTPYADYKGGLTVASADVNGDGRADIVVGTGRGIAARVSAFSGTNLAQIGSTINPFGNYSGGVYVAAGNVTGGTSANLVVGTATGQGSINVYSFNSGTNQFTQTGSTLTPFGTSGVNGVQVAVVNPNGGNTFDIAAATLTGNGTVKVNTITATGTSLGSFTFGTGASGFGIGKVDQNQDGTFDLMIGASPNGTGQINIVNPLTGATAGSFNAFNVLTGGVSLDGA
jgi:hypothetical protein